MSEKRPFATYVRFCLSQVVHALVNGSLSVNDVLPIFFLLILVNKPMPNFVHVSVFDLCISS